MSGPVSSYDRNVFINCPFEEEYLGLFMAMIFTVVECGFTPRCSLEASNSGQVRVQKIMQIIEECRLGIHDISRTELDKSNGLPRFNMPFELGIFLGCHRFGGDGHKDKSCIVLDRESYRYQKFISDIAGQSINSHDGRKDLLVEKIRNWLSTQLSGSDPVIPCGDVIFARYNEFQEALPALCETLRFRHNKLTFRDMMHLIKSWSQLNSASKVTPSRPIPTTTTAKAALIRARMVSVRAANKAAVAKAAAAARSASIKRASVEALAKEAARRAKPATDTTGSTKTPTA